VITDTFEHLREAYKSQSGVCSGMMRRV